MVVTLPDHLSYSQINTYLTCPLRYRLQYVEQIPAAFVPAALAFGSGIHMCAGMSLARLEGRLAIERFLKRFPSYVLDGAAQRSRRARFRGFTALPVRLR